MYWWFKNKKVKDILRFYGLKGFKIYNKIFDNKWWLNCLDIKKKKYIENFLEILKIFRINYKELLEILK